VVTQAPLRVLVVDDSAYNRRNIADILGGRDDIEVVGKAGDGDEALRLVSQLKPDVITLDLEMPRMDGFTFLRILMAKSPTPVIVVSSYSNKENVFKALELGAIDFVAKPDRQFAPEPAIRQEILGKVLLVRNLRPLSAPMPVRVAAANRASSAEPSLGGRAASLPSAGGVPRYLVVIASSTGGPSALLDVFSRLPERFPGAILIAQHMPDKFTKTFAERLDKKGAVRVVEAQDGDTVTARRAYVCPGKQCMELTSASGGMGDLRIRVSAPAPTDRYVPSADRLLRSAAPLGGSRTIGIILTGMGDDGVAGGRVIRAAGGSVIVESEETAVVYGMPGAAVRAGIVSEEMPLPAIGDYLAGLS
jgi:two-component system chemotaxis response regulator CheB